MTEQEVIRYLELAERRVFLLAHAGVDWRPEYGAVLQSIGRGLSALRKKGSEEHRRREAVAWGR